MNPELLSLKPKRFLCPYCGKWHRWQLGELENFNSRSKYAQVACPYSPNTFYSIWFTNTGRCHYIIDRLCGMCWGYKNDFSGSLSIDYITEGTDKPTVTFKYLFEPLEKVGRHECSECTFVDECIYAKLSDERDNPNNPFLRITLGFEYAQSDYDKFPHDVAIPDKKMELQESKKAIAFMERVLKELKDVVDSKEQLSQRSQVKKNKEATTMKMNMEFGPIEDENIVSTMMGVAVKNGDSWRIYDKKKKKITDFGNMQLGNFPILIWPTTELSEGDLIKDDEEYYFVTKVATHNTLTQTLSARTGEIKNVVPIQNILGFSCYSKVIALNDLLDMGDDFDNMEKLAIMSAMCGQTGETGDQMKQLLPLMLFKDKLGGDDDKMKLLLMSSMMTSKDDGGQMNSWLPLMLFKDKLGGDDDKMKLLLMSSTIGGNMAGSNNSLMSYLMLDAFMDKKDDKTLQSGVGTAQ